MAQQDIVIGMTGETAKDVINENFNEVYGAKIDKRLILATASLSTQGPVAVDTPHQILFGTSNIVTPEMDYDTSGTYTIKEDGDYEFLLTLQYGRTGAGGTSWLYARFLINGAAASLSALGKLDSSENDFPIQFVFDVPAVAGQVLTWEILRGSEGTNAGELIATIPANPALFPVPSAGMAVRVLEFTPTPTP